MSLVNNSDRLTIRGEGTGVSINVAGLNRIGTLYADGDVHITGTGIVLIDSIDIRNGSALKLLTNTDLYTDGSAAVFLRNPDTGCYELINGKAVHGILDEQYTIPTGVTLIIPDESVLEMRVAAGAGQSSGSEDISFSVPELTIASGACLKLENGARLLMEAFRFQRESGSNPAIDLINASTLNVAGTLELAGEIAAQNRSGSYASDRFTLNILSGGRISGTTGSIADAVITYEDGAGQSDTLNLTGGCYVQLGGDGIGQLNVAGSTTVICRDGAAIGNVSAVGNSTVLFCGSQNGARYAVTGTVKGSYSVSSGYLSVGGVLDPMDFAGSQTGGIPLWSVSGVLGTHVTDDPRMDYWTDTHTAADTSRPTLWQKTELNRTSGGTVDFGTLRSQTGCEYYEVYTLENGKTVLHLLSAQNAETVAMGNILLIRGVNCTEPTLPGGVSVDDQSLTAGQKNDSGWNAADKSGWRYDGSSVSLVNNGSPVNILAGSDVNISAAGLNLIGTLRGDGNVNITGTGIILIDRIDLAEGKRLNLLTNTDMYQEGSAAVFLYDPDTQSYRMINGTVPGILDEQYTIPSGVKLVVPDEGILDMRITTQVTKEVNGEVVDTHYGITAADQQSKDSYKNEVNEDGQTVFRTLDITLPKLTISSGAVLRLEKGAEMRMQAFHEKVLTDGYHRSTLVVEGKLELEGEITAIGSSDGESTSFALEMKDTGNVTGSGTMSCVAVKYAGGSGCLNFTGSGSFVNVTCTENGSMKFTTTGKTEIFYSDGTSIGALEAKTGGEFVLYAKTAGEISDIDYASRLNITDSVAGKCTVGSGYVSLRGNLLNESFAVSEESLGTTIQFQTMSGSSAFDVTGKPPVQYGFCHYEGGCTAGFKNWTSGTENTDYLAAAGGINFNTLASLVSGEIEGFQVKLFEVYTYDPKTDCVDVRLLWKSASDSSPHEETVDLSKVFLIRAAALNLSFTPTYTEPSINTGTSNTGAGILGGSGAGSLNGGNANSVLDGSASVPGGSLGGTDTSGTGSGVLGGSGSFTGGNANSVLNGSSSRPEASGGSGGSMSSTDTSGTGSGVLGGSGSFTGGNANSILSGRRPRPVAPSGASAASAEESVAVVLKISETATDNVYHLAAYYGSVQLQSLGGPVRVEMSASLEPDWNPNDLFAVFRDETGALVAVKVRYNAATGKLEFNAPMLGDFRLVCMHWDGTDYTDRAFLEALEACLNGWA